MSEEFETVRLPYGDSYLEAAVPMRNLAAMVTRQDIPGLDDEASAIREALRHPIGCAPLLEQLGKASTVAVIVTDNTRACPDDRILPVLLSELEQNVRRENITIVVALGLHPPMSRDELETKLGRDIVERYRVINHDPGHTVFLGTTSRGTPVEVNRGVVEADFRISTGFIEPHFFAGFSGGRKSIAPGVSSARAIQANHSFTMLDHPLARTGILAENPVHEDMVEQARLAGLDFIVNVLLNKERRITHVVAGDLVEAHEQGCEIERKTAGVPIEKKADIVISTNGGAPLDLDFYQTCKGIDTAARFTRDGGIIIIAAYCDRGVGPEAFYELHTSATGPGEVLERLRDAGPQGVSWQNQILARAQLRYQIYLVSSLDEEIVRRMMVVPVRSIEDGIEKALGVLGRDATIAVVPEGPFVLPVEKDTGH